MPACRVLVIDGHPDPEPGRLCHALADAYAEGALAAGHEVRRTAIAALDFPVLRSAGEFADAATVAPDVAAFQSDLAWCEHLLMVYPLWLGTLPALLKALLEQALRPGVAFSEEKGEESRFPRGLLAGRTAHVAITMGMPAFAYRWYFRAHSLRSLERNVLRLCGIRTTRETLLGMVEAVSEVKRGRWIERMRDLGRRAA